MRTKFTGADITLWLDANRGVYIPRDFANSFADRAVQVLGVSGEDWAILESGPDAENYWDAWTEVLNNAKIVDASGNIFWLYEDDDLWLIPEGMEWNEEIGFFAWPTLS